MAWVPWSRPITSGIPCEQGSLGIEMSASRARAATSRTTRNRPVPLDDPHTDLPLAISMEHRAPELGRAGTALVRKLPHLMCAGFLPHLGRPREWKGGRHRLSVGDALGLAFGRLRASCGGFPKIYLGLPAYLSHAQVAKLRALANTHRFPIHGTISSALAMAADRAAALLSQPAKSEPRTEGVVPMHRPGQQPWPLDAIVVDADEHALSGSLIRIEPDQVSLLSTTSLPRAGVKAWHDRLVDSLADRCVRVCRRDPRDSADAEQSLFEQLDAGLDSLRGGKHVNLTIRAAHWCQDLHLQSEDFDNCCSALIRSSVEGIRELLEGGSAVEPPRAVWLTHEAGRLPGLAQALFLHMAERTSVGVLRPEAAAIAIANLGEHWPGGDHLDSTIPIMTRTPETRQALPAAKTRL